MAFNETVVQVKFHHDGNTELSAYSSAKPSAVFADDVELTETPVQFNSGLTPSNEAWTYDQNNHVLTVFADPSSITIFYGSAQTPVPEFPAPIVSMLGVSVFITAGLAMILSRRRITR